ncbi:MAG: NADH-quinone oxidoreductase subunit C [Mycolicibacterium sp.]|nr:NADH-quinone oxidoreductase subunit C [Mycolicibacterium sp.]
MYGSHDGGRPVLDVLLADADGVYCLRTDVAPDVDGRFRYPSLTPQVPAAFWYERALHDLSGVVPVGHPRPDPLLLPRDPGAPPPRPGGPPIRGVHSSAVERRGPADLSGRGVFSLPLGPVRSGVFESIEFLIETPGEFIPHLNIRPHYKHRGIAKRFEGTTVDDAVLVAERVEGIASVAHALAFAHAAESLTGATPPRRARLIRVVHAELERIANHLDVVIRLCEAAGLAVPTARFGWHKETVLRLVSGMCGSRFGRNVVIAGGVATAPHLAPEEIAGRLSALMDRVAADRKLLMCDSTFLDRVRGTGHLDPELAAAHGALGPVGRGSGCTDDARRRPYDGYDELPEPSWVVDSRGDAQARLQVRLDEIDAAAALIQHACEHLRPLGSAPLYAQLDDDADGFATGWAEAPQGEVLYALAMRDGRVVRCFARSASLHNMLLFADVFGRDVLTDFPFIEASFGLSYAGVAM